MKTDISNLEELTKKFNEEKKTLETNFAKKREELLTNAKTEFSSSLSDTVKIFKALPDDVKKSITGDSAFVEVIKSFGFKVVKVTTATTRKTSTPRIKDEEILTYLASEHTMGEIVAHFHISAATAGKRINKLAEMSKISVRDVGTKKFCKII